MMNEPTSDDVFDREYHHHNFSDSPQLLLDLLDLFSMDVANLSEEISQALLQGDLLLVVRLSHKIKGSSASVGAVRMRRVAEKLEQAACGGDIRLVRSLLPLLDREITAVIRERKHLGSF